METVSAKRLMPLVTASGGSTSPVNWLNGGCAPYGLTAAQAVVILIACDFGVLTQDEMTKRLSLDKSVIAKTVSKLTESGFLTRRPDENDRRTFTVRPTPKATEVYPQLCRQIDDCFLRMTRSLTEDERRQFARLLALAAESAAPRKRIDG